MSTSTLTSKGQVTLPQRVRQSLGLRPGDKVDFVDEGGSFRLVAVRSDVRLLTGRLIGLDTNANYSERRCGFVDAVLATAGISAGCSHTVTFDRGAAGAGMTLLE